METCLQAQRATEKAGTHINAKRRGAIIFESWRLAFSLYTFDNSIRKHISGGDALRHRLAVTAEYTCCSIWVWT